MSTEETKAVPRTLEQALAMIDQMKQELQELAHRVYRGKEESPPGKTEEEDAGSEEGFSAGSLSAAEMLTNYDDHVIAARKRLGLRPLKNYP